MLNRTPTPEPRSLSSESTDGEQMSCTKETISCEDDDAASKKADSGIGESVPSPVPDSLPSDGSAHETKSTFESSSDDDEMIRVYNFKLGKTVIQPLVEHEMLQTAHTPPTTPVTPNEAAESKLTKLEETEPTPSLSETTSWNFCIPISPPANFADGSNKEEVPDVPITPKITERPVLNFAVISEGEINNNNTNTTNKHAKLEKQDSKESTGTSTLDEIVDELSAVVQDKGVNSLMKKPAFTQEIESAKPNTLSNFSIASIEKSVGTLATPAENTEDLKEEVTHKRSNLSLKINRADSFHTAMNSNVETAKLNGLNSRSSSLAALAKLETTANNIVTHGKSSSSELSIKESPSLQSLEIIKTILNSRKNSLANGSGSGSDVEPMEQQKTTPIKEELPKTYRYSGPPSINLGCWNERPKKAQVAIKNEGDYIFGGKSLQKNTPSVRHSIGVVENKEKSQLYKLNFNAKPNNNENKQTSPVSRMGIPEKEYHIPITVKPLKDFCVESTPKADQNNSTLPRNNIPKSVAVKRSSSIKAFEVANSPKESNEVPFGQNTLRKTGLKEKILANEGEPKEESIQTTSNIFAVHLRKQNSSTTATPKLITKQIFHTKLHIPLQQSMSVQSEERTNTPTTPKTAPVAPPPPPMKPVKTPNNTPII